MKQKSDPDHIGRGISQAEFMRRFYLQLVTERDAVQDKCMPSNAERKMV
jgi:hypothetical protein